ncbi:MAG: isochorismatase family protein [Chitinophagaceae bacterium]|nr:isochorismatase family protein [Anaerolineae bacterium]
MQAESFIENSKPFIQWMLDWQAGLTSLSLAEIIKNEPEKVGIVSVDVIKGFCTVGPLASPRIDGIVAPITRLFELAWNSGIRDIALTQDTHPENAVEFMSYAPHCIRGTEESETVEAFKALPFFNQLTVIEKNSINSGLDEEFADWIRARPQIKNWIVVGDCTDLCTHQLAMHIRISANQNQIEEVRVILPVNTVDTYDLPVNIAQEIGAVPHDGEFLHLVFLYHMMLNGVEIITEITA